MRVTDDGPGFIRISDALPLAEDTSSCRSLSRTELRCPAPPTATVSLLLGAGAGRARIATTRRVTVDGGSGDDTYAGGLTAGSSQVVFRGGLGKDLADYHDATQPVTVKLGNGPGDGRSADFDDITDAEHVIGSRFGDGLAAPAGRRARHRRLRHGHARRGARLDRRRALHQRLRADRADQPAGRCDAARQLTARTKSATRTTAAATATTSRSTRKAASSERSGLPIRTAALEDVDRRVDDDPHHVDEVPVDPGHLDAAVLLGR